MQEMSWERYVEGSRLTALSITRGNWMFEEVQKDRKRGKKFKMWVGRMEGEVRKRREKDASDKVVREK